MTVVSSWGYLALRDEHRSGDPHSVVLSPAARTMVCSSSNALVVLFDDGGQPSSAGCVNRAIAQMKPTISRAIAVVTMTLDLPVAASRR